MTTWKETHGVPAPIRKFKKGAKHAKQVENEETGGVAGYHVEHHDGSVDAVITPATVGVKTTTQEGDGS